jgi:hypothetical protein
MMKSWLAFVAAKPGVSIRRQEATKSPEVTGSPLDQRAPARRWNV